MLKKFTQEKVSKLYEEKGYELISEYKNTNNLLFVKDSEGYVCSSRFRDFKQGIRPRKFHMNNPYTVQNIRLWIKTNAEGYELLSTKYDKAIEKLLFRCPKGHEFKMSWACFQEGHRCVYCCHNPKSKLGINTIWDTDRWMCDLGVSEKDAKKYSKSSGNKINAICPNCGKVINKRIADIYRNKTIACNCGDGTSYPEKFIICLLEQLGIEYKHDGYWIEDKRYDFYLSKYNTIIECNGKQHYTKSFEGCDSRTLEEEQENDKYKKELALNNGIDKYIVLDCRDSNLSWIKKSILNSEMNILFNLDGINWLKCEEFALSNRAKEVCDYWNQKEELETTKDLVDVFNLSKLTIISYLKRGTKLGWCKYDPEEERKNKGIKMRNKNGKPVMIFKENVCVGAFPTLHELDRQSENIFGIHLNFKTICNACNGKIKQYKGFTFKYITKEEYIQYLQNPDNYIKKINKNY